MGGKRHDWSAGAVAVLLTFVGQRRRYRPLVLATNLLFGVLSAIAAVTTQEHAQGLGGVNRVGYSGVMTSPFFGQPTAMFRGPALMALAGLESAHGILQVRVNRELRLKRTPQLTFEYDPTIERGVRLSQLIDELAPEEHDPD